MWVTLAQCYVSKAWLLGPQEIVEKVWTIRYHVCAVMQNTIRFFITGSCTTPLGVIQLHCVYID